MVYTLACKILLSLGTTGHVDKDLVFLDIHLSQCMKMFPLNSHIRTPVRKLIRFRIHRCHSNYNPLHSELENKIVKIVNLWSCDCETQCVFSSIAITTQVDSLKNLFKCENCEIDAKWFWSDFQSSEWKNHNFTKVTNCEAQFHNFQHFFNI